MYNIHYCKSFERIGWDSQIAEDATKYLDVLPQVKRKQGQRYVRHSQEYR